MIRADCSSFIRSGNRVVTDCKSFGRNFFYQINGNTGIRVAIELSRQVISSRTRCRDIPQKITLSDKKCSSIL